jgi:chemotaxis response regulator CheB
MTYAQDEQSSVVYGMPRAAKSLGAVSKELPLEDIAEELLQLNSYTVTPDV